MSLVVAALVVVTLIGVLLGWVLVAIGATTPEKT
jgi:hypothetical protein